MKKFTQRFIQIATLALFVILFIKGNIQMWMIIFVGSTLLALIFSRFYCGWLCPINTLFIPINWVKKKLKIKRQKMPSWITSDVFRIIFLVLFLGAMVFVFVSGKKLPVLPALLVIGVILTIFFDEALWHRHLCPYGTILSLPARFSKKSVTINPELCNNCTLCARVCPTNTIIKDEKHMIVKKECLVCLECQRVCPKGAITYT